MLDPKAVAEVEAALAAHPQPWFLYPTAGGGAHIVLDRAEGGHVADFPDEAQGRIALLLRNLAPALLTELRRLGEVERAARDTHGVLSAFLDGQGTVLNEDGNYDGDGVASLVSVRAALRAALAGKGGA